MGSVRLIQSVSMMFDWLALNMRKTSASLQVLANVSSNSNMVPDTLIYAKVLQLHNPDDDKSHRDKKEKGRSIL